jgi:CheY-like chemotaxis protein
MSATRLNRLPRPLASIVERLAGIERRVPPSPRTVLIVDDEEPICRFVNRVLQSAGYTTVLAANGPEAIRVAVDTPSIDLLVTDMMMPDMNGSEVARRLRQDHPGLKVLYFTGFCDRLFDEKVTMWDDEAFLEKPCSVKGLLEAVSLLWSDHIVGVPVNRSAELS